MYNQVEDLRIKEKNHFSLVCKLTEDDDKTEVSLANYQIKSHIRDAKGNLILNLTVSPINLAKGIFLLESNTVLEYTKLPLFLDVQFIHQGVIVNTDTIRLIVDKVVTYG